MTTEPEIDFRISGFITSVEKEAEKSRIPLATRARLQCDSDLVEMRHEQSCDENHVRDGSPRLRFLCAVDSHEITACCKWLSKSTRAFGLAVRETRKHMLLGKRESREKRVTPNHIRRYWTPFQEKPRDLRQRHDRLQQWCTTDEHEDESAVGECISYYKVVLNDLPGFRG